MWSAARWVITTDHAKGPLCSSGSCIYYTCKQFAQLQTTDSKCRFHFKIAGPAHRWQNALANTPPFAPQAATTEHLARQACTLYATKAGKQTEAVPHRRDDHADGPGHVSVRAPGDAALRVQLEVQPHCVRRCLQCSTVVLKPGGGYM